MRAAIQTGVQFRHDGDGRRVKKYVASTGETTVFVYDASGKLAAEYSTIVANSTDAKVAYLTADHLGSPRINTDQNGTVTARHDYHPFGEEIATAQRTTVLGYLSGNDGVRKQFTGYERDRETDLDFARARMFSFSIGRFASPDPLLSSGRIGEPQTWDRYGYSLNNPLSLVDPSGLYEFRANATDNQKKKFRQALKDVEKARDKFKWGTTKYNRLNDVLKAYGGEVTRDANGKVVSGDENGVNVGFDKFTGKEKDITGKTTPSFSFDVATSKTTAIINVTINTSFLNDRDEMAVTAAHEGQHVEDAQAFAALDWVKGDVVNSSLNLNHYQLEVRGYEVTSFMLEAQGNENARYEGEQLWSRGWKEADDRLTTRRTDAIDRFLIKSPAYEHANPKDQGRRYLEP